VDFYIPTGFTTPIDQFFDFMQAVIPLKKHDLHWKSTFFQKFLKGAIIYHIERTFSLIQPLNVEV